MVTKEANAPGDDNKNKNTSMTTMYPNLTDFFHCQTKEHPLSRTQQQLPSNLTFVAHTMLAFAPARRMLPSWVEYHRVIMGIQHFIIYVNEPWSNFTRNPDYFYHPPYITYVPFRESLGLNPFKFQHAAQIDAIQRLHGSSVEWIAMMDVDEYFQLTATTTVNKNASSPQDTGALLQLLREQYDLSVKNTKKEVASFTVRGPRFGYHPHQNSSNLKDLPICAQLGRETANSNIKLFVRPNITTYISIHGVTGGETEVHLNPTTTGLRFGHFHAERIVFDNENTVVMDESFRDQACSAVRHELQSYFPRYKDDNMTAPPDIYAYDNEEQA